MKCCWKSPISLWEADQTSNTFTSTGPFNGLRPRLFKVSDRGLHRVLQVTEHQRRCSPPPETVMKHYQALSRAAALPIATPRILSSPAICSHGDGDLDISISPRAGESFTPTQPVSITGQTHTQKVGIHPSSTHTATEPQHLFYPLLSFSRFILL